MNIKSRLKKMESQLIKEDAEFCGCERGVSIRLPGDAPFPETCDVCGKPLLIKVITFNTNSDVELTGKA